MTKYEINLLMSWLNFLAQTFFLNMRMEFFFCRGPFAKGFGAIKNHVYEKRNNQIENDIFLRLEKGT